MFVFSFWNDSLFIDKQIIVWVSLTASRILAIILILFIVLVFGVIALLHVAFQILVGDWLLFFIGSLLGMLRHIQIVLISYIVKMMRYVFWVKFLLPFYDVVLILVILYTFRFGVQMLLRCIVQRFVRIYQPILLLIRKRLLYRVSAVP